MRGFLLQCSWGFPWATTSIRSLGNFVNISIGFHPFSRNSTVVKNPDDSMLCLRQWIWAAAQKCLDFKSERGTLRYDAHVPSRFPQITRETVPVLPDRVAVDLEAYCLPTAPMASRFLGRLPKLIAFDLECVRNSCARLMANVYSYTLWPLWISTHSGCMWFGISRRPC
jgi:hypothetical protein